MCYDGMLSLKSCFVIADCVPADAAAAAGGAELRPAEAGSGCAGVRGAAAAGHQPQPRPGSQRQHPVAGHDRPALPRSQRVPPLAGALSHFLSAGVRIMARSSSIFQRRG